MRVSLAVALEHVLMSAGTLKSFVTMPEMISSVGYKLQLIFYITALPGHSNIDIRLISVNILGYFQSSVIFQLLSDFSTMQWPGLGEFFGASTYNISTCVLNRCTRSSFSATPDT